MSDQTPSTDTAQAGEKRLPVVLAADRRYLRGLVVTGHSLLRHLAPDWTADLTLLTDDFGEEDERVLRGVLDHAGRPYTLQIRRVSVADFEGCPAMAGGSRMAYARLLCPRLLPGRRALYVDVDIVVQRDMSRLAALPWPAGSLLHAARDGSIHSCSMSWERIPCAELGIPPDASYFNSGVIWMDLEGWRREGVEAMCHDYLRRYPDRVAFFDQSALNAVLWNRWTLLENAWNLPSESAISRLAVYPLSPTRDANIHYVSRKPWLQPHPFARYYWEEMERIAALVPPEFTRRPPWTRRALWHWTNFFGWRAYYHWGGFVKHSVLKPLRRGSAPR